MDSHTLKTNEETEVKIWTDASRCDTTKLGFFAYRIKIPRFDVDIAYSGTLGHIEDSNSGEVRAIVMAMKRLHDEGWPLVCDRITLITDSDFSKMLFKQTEKIKRTAIARFMDILQEFSYLCRIWENFSSMNIEVIKSHSNNKNKKNAEKYLMNRWCDLECRRLRKTNLKGREITIDGLNELR